MAYLDDSELDGLLDAVQELVGDYPSARLALLSPLPGKFRALLPVSPVPRQQLRSDFNRLNITERLGDGRVPLLLALRTLLSDFAEADVEAAKVASALYSKVAQRSSGAPPVAPAQLDEIKEAVIHQNDMLPAAFLRLGMEAGAAVARLTVPRVDAGVQARLANGDPVRFLGTGWLIAKGLLITNHHVINARLEGQAAASDQDLAAQAMAATIQFDYDDTGGPMSIAAAPVELVAADAALDYAVLRIDSGERAPLTLSATLPEPPSGHGAAAVNIIQHPDGDPKKFAIRNNLVVSSTERDIRYFTDTDQGSSGSPVFDDGWRVVALHRGSTAAAQLFQGRATAQVNLGTRVSAILAHLDQLGKRAELGL